MGLTVHQIGARVRVVDASPPAFAAPSSGARPRKFPFAAGAVLQVRAVSDTGAVSFLQFMGWWRPERFTRVTANDIDREAA